MTMQWAWRCRNEEEQGVICQLEPLAGHGGNIRAGASQEDTGAGIHPFDIPAQYCPITRSKRQTMMQQWLWIQRSAF